jgi:hypothetical protein
MADDANWAGRGFTRPGPKREPGSRYASMDYAGAPAGLTRDRAGECPLHIWGGYGHSEPFAECEGDREREAG